jgi:hypothetical protein
LLLYPDLKDQVDQDWISARDLERITYVEKTPEELDTDLFEFDIYEYVPFKTASSYDQDCRQFVYQLRGERRSMLNTIHNFFERYFGYFALLCSLSHTQRLKLLSDITSLDGEYDEVDALWGETMAEKQPYKKRKVETIVEKRTTSEKTMTVPQAQKYEGEGLLSRSYWWDDKK